MYSTDRIRDLAGRATTAAGSAALAAALEHPHSALISVPVALAAAGAGLVTTIRPTRPAVHDAVTALYLAPAAVLSSELVAFATIDGATLPKLAAGALWGTVTWYVRPARLAARLAAAAEASAADTTPVDLDVTGLVPDTALVPADSAALESPEGRLSLFWREAVACESGAAPGTHLENPIVLGPQDFRAEIVAAPGKAVGTVNTETLSAITDIPVEYFTVGPVPGRGAGRKILEVRPPAEKTDGTDIETVWAQRVATAAMPGATLIAVNRGTTTENEVSS